MKIYLAVRMATIKMHPDMNIQHDYTHWRKMNRWRKKMIHPDIIADEEAAYKHLQDELSKSPPMNKTMYDPYD
jgi:uncharacterized protein with HEPN domain